MKDMPSINNSSSELKRLSGNIKHIVAFEAHTLYWRAYFSLYKAKQLLNTPIFNAHSGSSYLHIFFLLINTDNEQLARSGVNCLENLVVSNGKKFTPEVWGKTTQCIRLIFESSVPHNLMKWKPENYTPPPAPAPAPIEHPTSPQVNSPHDDRRPSSQTPSKYGKKNIMILLCSIHFSSLFCLFKNLEYLVLILWMATLM